MEAHEFITSLDNKTFSQIRNSKGDAECIRYLKEHLIKQNQEGLSLSFWFMRDNQTFIKVELKTLDEIVGEFKKISKKYPYGMVCPVTIRKDDDDLRRVGKGCHVDKNGHVKLSDWITEISNDEDIKRILNEDK